ncbi:hypothetical protein BGZ70_004975, partial [Mortierella alpina]
MATRLKTLLQRQYREDFWSAQSNGAATPPSSALSPANFQQLASEINQKLEADFDRHDCELHFDGALTLQKQAEHASRAARYRQERRAAKEFMRKISNRVTNILQPNPRNVTSSDRTKLVKWIKAANKHWKAVLKVPQSVRTGLADALAQLGWGVHRCPGESDTCIALRQNQVPQQQIIVSLILLRQNTRKRREFTRYDSHAARATTGLSPAAWKVLAITSGNDYATNKKGWGLTKNFGLIQTILADGAHTTEDQIIQRYRQLMNMDEHHFDHAVEVFAANTETLLAPEAPTTTLDDYYLTSVFAVGFNLQELATYERLESAPDPAYRRRAAP